MLFFYRINRMFEVKSSVKKTLYFLATAVLCALILVGCSAKDRSLGIIGGADGPTAVFIS